MSTPYYKAKPSNETKGGDPGLEPRSKQSENPMVIAAVERAVARYRDGRPEAFLDLEPWEIRHLLAAGLLTDEELEATGLAKS
ncbi:hypothetical protein [Histidinibacterium aquaticum]|uniref:hypothetical protein n=1 Tax=Histidinibacterium aquaticum TaxID=2613962 RepID=UPI001CC66405|nr:hypothetical protein [Histidinibacterium aquaticum]